jgi:broad specificity phosphatase PhoE
MPVIVLRHGEREDAENEKWVATAERPWDPALTEHGKEQSRKAGRAIAALCKQLGLSPPSAIYSSPLTRCVQTSRHAARALGIGTVKTRIEPSLWETLSKDWWLSWAVPGATGKWGGPSEWRYAQPQILDQVHPAAFGPLSDLVPLSYAGVRADEIDHGYQPHVPASAMPYSWNLTETVEADSWTGFEPDTAKRLGAFVEKCQLGREDETILLVTHGGPSAAVYHYLTGTALQGGSKVVDNTGFHIFEMFPDRDLGSGLSSTDSPVVSFPEWGGWRAVVKAHNAHLFESSMGSAG